MGLRRHSFVLMKDFTIVIVFALCFGGIAQLVERLVRNEKVRGSNPLTSRAEGVEVTSTSQAYYWSTSGSVIPLPPFFFWPVPNSCWTSTHKSSPAIGGRARRAHDCADLRHRDADAIAEEIRNLADSIPVGSVETLTLTIDGKTVIARAHRLDNGVINVGRIVIKP
jgi:hypothetical protein